MYVCQCEVVTAAEVAESVDAGAHTVDAVGRETGAGTCCGVCHPTIQALIDSRRGESPRLSIVVA